jgi:hypothetical protein
VRDVVCLVVVEESYSLLASLCILIPFCIIKHDLASFNHPASAHVEAVMPDHGPRVTIVALQREVSSTCR